MAGIGSIIGRIDTSGVIAALDKVDRQVAFGTARGLTQAARGAARASNDAMESRFDRPTPFTRNATAFQPATRDRLTATVFVKDVQAEYLGVQETGGAQRPRPGRPINVPVKLKLNRHGNVPFGALARMKARPDVFVSNARDPKVKHLPKGIYQRQPRPKGKSMRGRRTGLARLAPPPKLLVAFEPLARYQPRFGFRDGVVAYVSTTGVGMIRGSIVDALSTARW